MCVGVGGANTTPYLFSAVHFAKQKIYNYFLLLQNMNSVDKKEKVSKPARIPPQTPPAGGKSAEAKRKILSPRKTDFRFAESVLKLHALPEYLEDRTPKEKHPFLFQKKFHPRQIRNARSVFSFGVAGVLASAWGFLRAYRAVSSHHARGACDIICFGNRCELGTIETPVVTCSSRRHISADKNVLGDSSPTIIQKADAIASAFCIIFCLCSLLFFFF